MPRTIDEGFRDFHTNLTPNKTESEKAKTHRASIEACLDNNFNLLRFFRSGSFGNGTSIRGFSDVDYFASFSGNVLKQNSAGTLILVRNKLKDRFPDTGIGVSCPAVIVPFGTSNNESTEVVPAEYMGKTPKGYHIYDIPDCQGGWMKSSPDTHNKYVREINKKLGYKAKPIIRFIKAWKYLNSVPVSSFYLEMRVAKYLSSEKSALFSIDVRNIFAILNRIELANLQDPTGISGYISPTLSSLKLIEAKSKIRTALSRAEKAREAEKDGKISEAFYWWNLLFNDKFPSYYR